MSAYGPVIALVVVLVVWLACIVAVYRDDAADGMPLILRFGAAVAFGTAFAAAVLVFCVAVVALILFIYQVMP